MAGGTREELIATLYAIRYADRRGGDIRYYNFKTDRYEAILFSGAKFVFLLHARPYTTQDKAAAVRIVQARNGAHLRQMNVYDQKLAANRH